MNPSDSPEDKTLLVFLTDRQLYAFDLSDTVRIAVGRHESNDLKLASRTVSNFHAEILHEAGSVSVRDLGSTNGTFVNDEKVRHQHLVEGDRIRIGNHVLTVHLEAPMNRSRAAFALARSTALFAPGTTGAIVSIRGNAENAHKTLQARGPHDLSLADLLKILSTQASSVALSLTRGEEKARVWLRKEHVIHAEYGSAFGEKALYRLFGWREASYEILGSDEEGPVPRTIELPTDTLVLEGMKHADEVGRLAASLPPLGSPLRLKESCPLPVSAYSPAELEVFQGIIRYETIGKLLEVSTLTDVRLLKLVDSLLRKGAFEVATRSETLLESTFVSQTRPS